MKPFLKWAGGKRKILPAILDIIRPHLTDECTFFEPFVGGGVVSLTLKHPNLKINDINSDLIECYLAIKDNPNELMRLLDFHLMHHNAEHYYSVRALDRDPQKYNALSNIEKAARLVYLNKTCYNGLFRVNSKGQFNTPIGRYVNPKIYDYNNIMSISEYFTKAMITATSTSFEHAVSDAKKGDFIYFDPPYDYETNGFREYHKNGFNDFDLRNLREVSDALIEKGCFVLLSNNDTEKVRMIFSSEFYHIYPIKYSITVHGVPRRINCDANGRGEVTEVLIFGSKCV